MHVRSILQFVVHVLDFRQLDFDSDAHQREETAHDLLENALAATDCLVGIIPESSFS